MSPPTFICPVHFTYDDSLDDDFENRATFKLKSGHIHVKRWNNNNVIICSSPRCILRQKEHDLEFNKRKIQKYNICFRENCK